MPQPLSDVDICNLALANVNQKPILTRGDANELARMVNRWYDPMRRELLEDCDWTFARRTFKLNLIGEATGVANFPDWAAVNSTPAAGTLTDDNFVFPWAFIYKYPAKVLFVHKVYNVHSPTFFDENSGYAGTMFRSWIESQKPGWELIRSRKTNEFAIACNIQSAICKYTEDLTDTSMFSTKFTTALSLKIAQRIVMPLTGDKELKADIGNDLRLSMEDAFRNNHSENPEHGPRSSSYEDARGM